MKIPVVATRCLLLARTADQGTGRFMRTAYPPLSRAVSVAGMVEGERSVGECHRRERVETGCADGAFADRCGELSGAGHSDQVLQSVEAVDVGVEGGRGDVELGGHAGQGECVEPIAVGDVDARSAGRPLTIAGIVQDEQYFTDEIAPRIDGESVRFLGPVDSANRAQVLGSAHALLHLIDFDEPFGYSVVEAMACGTPVVAYNRGSVTEIIDHATTGLVVENAEDATHAVDLVGALDRPAIRASILDRFSAETMVNKYIALYRSVLSTRVRKAIEG